MQDSRVRENWNNAHKLREEGNKPRFAWDHPVVSQFHARVYSDGLGAGPWLKRYLDGKKIHCALDIGGGTGNNTFPLSRLLDVERFDVLDISEYAVETGNRRAQEEGANIKFSQADLNVCELPGEEYDLICASGSLHHIENLEHALSQINSALKVDGYFFANDYMGPNHQQWTDVQLEIMNKLVATFPDRFSKVLHKDEQVIKEIRRVPLKNFAIHDPSEAVRSSEIFPLVADYLNVLQIVPLGYTILFELLRGRIHNFDAGSEEQDFVLNLLCVFEEILLDRGVIESDHNYILAAKKI